MLGLERAVDWYAKVIGLCFAELCQFDADFFQMQACNFFVEFLRQNVNADFLGVAILPEIQLSEHLIGK